MRQLVPVFLTVLVLAGCGERRTPDRTVDRNPDVPAARTTPPTTTVPERPAEPRTGTVGARDVDNTGLNVRDRNDATMTPPDQGNDEADLKRTADIRKRIVDAKLSSDATNVKVVTLNGRVTLRGPVKSQAEKDDVLRIAREVAGDANVDDQIEIESPTKR